MSLDEVVAQAWLGRICPLTILENSLRAKAGGQTYDGSFIARDNDVVVVSSADPNAIDEIKVALLEAGVDSQIFVDLR